MGTLCSNTCPKSSLTPLGNIIPLDEEELHLPSYKSSSDSHFAILEHKINFLVDISLSDYIHSLSKFSIESATLIDDYTIKNPSYSSNDGFFHEELPQDALQSFIENKLFKHPNVYKKAGSEEVLADRFKEMMLSIQKSLISKLEQHDKNKGYTFRKSHALAIGFLYCAGQFVQKCKLLFELFSNNGKLMQTESLSEFMLSLFLIASYCMLSARNKLATYEDIGEIDKETMKTILGNCELKDCENVLTVVNAALFEKDKKEYTFTEFKELFNDNEQTSLGWILSSQGIRSMLQKNNV